MTDDEKKALIIGGAVAVIGLALWLSKGAPIIPAGAEVQNAPPVGGGPGYTTYNVPPYNAPNNSQIYPSAMNDNGNGCCADGCFTSQGINTGNAPTSLTQLLALYANNGNPEFSKAFNSQLVAFNVPPQTIMEQTTAAVSGGQSSPNSIY